MWTAMRVRRRFTALEIEGDTHATLTAVRDYFKALIKAGYIEIVDYVDNSQTGLRSAAKKRPAIYELKRDDVEPPRVNRAGDVVTQGRGRENLWRSMRILKTFTTLDLAVQASTDDCVISEGDAKHYIKYLRRAGYIVTARREPHASALYRFIDTRYTGPRPPQIQRVHRVFDPNINKVVWPQGDNNE